MTLAGLRVAAGLTQADVAKQMGVTQGTISHWESGIDLPKIAKIAKLAAIYRTSEQVVLNACMKKPTQASYIVVKRKKR